MYSAVNFRRDDLLCCLPSGDNSKELIGRVSIKAEINGAVDPFQNGLEDQSDVISIFKNIQEDILNNVVIKGIKDINTVVMSEKKTYKKDYLQTLILLKTIVYLVG